MKYKTQILSFFLFGIFFFVGWKFSLINPSGVMDYQDKVLLRDLQIDLSPSYITDNQYKVDILHYDLKIDLYPENKILKGDALITGIILNDNVERIDLNLYDNLKIKDVLLNGKNSSYESKGTRFSVPINGLETDTFKVRIIYEGTPKRRGLSAFVFGEINNRSVVYNLNEPTYASTWFPCNDMPDDKALLDIRITNDSSKTSVSNGVLVKEDNSGGRKTYHWKTYYPISTYLICIYSADYIKFNDQYISQDNNDTMDIEYYAFPDHYENAKIDFEGHPKMMNFFAKSFGEYPFIKEKYGVAEFLWQLGAMEHQTITGIGSNFVSGRRFFNDVYVHELAHHWWGNAVGPATWKDIWLNEGFSTYSEALYAEHIAGEKALQSTMLSKFQDNFIGRLYSPDNLFSQTIYDKGAWVLHMLRWEIGDSLFFKILREYFDAYKYKNASTKDFQNLCETLSNKNLTNFFNQWVFEGEGEINLDYTWNIKSEEDIYLIELNLKQTQKEYNTYYFPLEIVLQYDNGENIYKTFYIDSDQKNFIIEAKRRPNDIRLDPNSWLLANISEQK